MSGLLDWHAIGILSRTWRELLAPDVAMFISLFQDADGNDIIPPSVLESWHAALTVGNSDHERAGFVRFCSRFNRNTPSVPQVAITLEDEPGDTKPLGNVARDSSGNMIRTMEIREEIAIDIWSQQPDLLKALHIVVRSILMSQVDDFIRLNYNGLFYLGGADLVPQEELMPGASYEPMVMLRQQRWYTTSWPSWRTVTTASKPHHVYAADVTVGGVQGGVEPDAVAAGVPGAAGNGPPTVMLTKSLVFNGVDTQLVHLLNALPAGECTFAFWLKYDLLNTAGQFLWDSSNGLGNGTAMIGGGKSADGGGRDRETFLFYASPPMQADGGVAQVRGIWDLWVFTRDAANDRWSIDTGASRDGGTAPWDVANPAGITEIAVGLSRGWTAPFRFDGKIARMWLDSGPGSYADSATCAAWRADPRMVISVAHEWNPGDTPGDTTTSIQDVGAVGGFDFTGAGGLIFDSDVP